MEARGMDGSVELNAQRESDPTPHAAFAVLFGIVGAMALSKFLDPDRYVIGVGTVTAGGLGICWIAYALVQLKWRPCARILLFSALSASAISLISAGVALAFAVEQGFTVDVPLVATSTPPRGTWLLWLFPSLACIATCAASWVAINDMIMARRYVTVTRHGASDQ